MKFIISPERHYSNWHCARGPEFHPATTERLLAPPSRRIVCLRLVFTVSCTFDSPESDGEPLKWPQYAVCCEGQRPPRPIKRLTHPTKLAGCRVTSEACRQPSID